MNKIKLAIIALVIGGFSLAGVWVFASGPLERIEHAPLDVFEAHPPIHVRGNATLAPTGVSPTTIKFVYHLPSSGGQGTIAIIDAFDDPNAESDLTIFSNQFALPSCTTANGCFEKHPMASKLRSNSGWALETSLDTQWAHAIAPNAKILLVAARSSNGTDLLKAVDYARSRPDVVAISMSWGGSEFSGEASYDTHFTSSAGATFFASSGDNGSGVSWPAVSSNVVGVGGTTLSFNSDGSLNTETAWSGSGGGVSVYEPAPMYQTSFGVPQSNNMRAVPDVSYNADPASGFSVYDTIPYNGQKGWFSVGGTSAGAPQWAAIRALGDTHVNNNSFYQDASSTAAATYFRDILQGTNGTCGFYCTSGMSYDCITGLGSPLTITY